MHGERHVETLGNARVDCIFLDTLVSKANRVSNKPICRAFQKIAASVQVISCSRLAKLIRNLDSDGLHRRALGMLRSKISSWMRQC